MVLNFAFNQRENTFFWVVWLAECLIMRHTLLGNIYHDGTRWPLLCKPPFLDQNQNMKAKRSCESTVTSLVDSVLYSVEHNS